MTSATPLIVLRRRNGAYRNNTSCQPVESTLRDYTNAIHPQDGFSGEIDQEVKKATASLTEHQQCVVLLHNVMAIKSDLVCDVDTGQVVGFVNF